jgi:transcriptional regulator with XRE-family HTH domain
MSQRDLGKEMGFSSSAYVHFLETGQRKPNVELLIKLAEFFEITMDELARDDREIEEGSE